MKKRCFMSNSLANRQLLALIRGEIPVQKPKNPFRVEAVKEESMYCLQCYGVRTFDVVYAQTLLPFSVETVMKICRSCQSVW